MRAEQTLVGQGVITVCQLIVQYFRGLQRILENTVTNHHNLSLIVDNAVGILANLRKLDVQYEHNWEHSFVTHANTKDICRNLGNFVLKENKDN